MRRAVSGEMARRPRMIAVTRLCGILRSMARRYWVTSIGSRNSVWRISPGWGKRSDVDDFGILGLVQVNSSKIAPKMRITRNRTYLRMAEVGGSFEGIPASSERWLNLM